MRDTERATGTFADTLIDWFASSGRDLPWRQPECSPWGVLVSEVMLQQTPVARVIVPFGEWLSRWPSPAALAASSAGEAVRAWGRLGYPRRALALHSAAGAIVQHHGGEVPHRLEDLLALPGVGEYTARAVAAFGFGLRHPVVDTNVRRVLARAIDGHGQAGPPSPRRDLADMERQLPEDPVRARAFNAAAMELGAVRCTARAPRCDDCPVADLCAWRAAGRPAYDGPQQRVQARFEGSDRQVRGTILAQLRGAAGPVNKDFLASSADPDQRQRALAGLVRDGLVRLSDDAYSLPS